MYYDTSFATFDAGRVSSALFLDLAGPLCLRDAHGADLTPKAPKAQGLLALIGTSPCLRRSRIWLQDKLWSECGPEQGAASLRQCLLRIRSALGEKADILRTDRGWIAFDSRVIVRTEPSRRDLGGEVEFLEGLDIRDPEFEDWLREQRNFYWERWNRTAAEPIKAPAVKGHSAPLIAKASSHSAGRPRASVAGRQSHRRATAENAPSDLAIHAVARSLLARAADLARPDNPASLAERAVTDGTADIASLSHEQRQAAARLAFKTLCNLFEARDLVALDPGARPETVRKQPPRQESYAAHEQRRGAGLH